MSTLPKLFRVVEIEFSSLRNGLGGSMGMVFGIDTMVRRKARRVLCDDGWKWQIFNALHESYYDYSVETDQEILNEIGMDESEIRVIA